MKKLLLVAVTFLSLGALWSVPAYVSAAEITSTTTIHADNNTCDEKAALSLDETTYKYNDKVTLRFKNTGAINLEVRNIPGGSLTVAPHTTAERSFTAKGNFVYGVWTTDTVCEKTAARVEVTGGWLIRLWPWGLALIGSVLVVWIVSKAGHRPPPAPHKPAKE